MDMNGLLWGILFGVCSGVILWIHYARVGRKARDLVASFPYRTPLRPLVCQVLSPTSCQKVTLALEDISADYAGYEGRSEMQGKVGYGITLGFLDRFLHMGIPGTSRAMNFGLFKQVGACHLFSEEIALISFTRGASLQAACDWVQPAVCALLLVVDRKPWKIRNMVALEKQCNCFVL